MRILMLSWRGPAHPKAGGAEVYTEHLLRRLVEKGHEAEWHSAAYGPDMPSSHRGIRLTYGASGMAIYLSGHRYARTAEGFDILVDQMNVFGFLTPLIRKPSIALIHQLADNVWEAETSPPVSWIGKGLERGMLQLYKDSPYITVSPSTDEDLRGAGWRGPGFLVPNGIDIAEAAYAKTPHPTLVFLARFGAKAKRLDHAVRIFEKVRKAYPETELWIIGRGQAPEWLQPDEKIKIYQGVSDEERDRLIGEAWCCIATSVREGWGRMVLESAMFRTPSVVYDVHGLRDAVIHGKTGYIVPEDPEAAAERIRELFADPRLLKRLGHEAREHAETFTWARSVAAFEEALERVIGAKTKTP